MSDSFRDKLRGGGTVTVVNPDHPSASLVEFMGGLPIDAVFIDCEHGGADVETVEHMARAARLAGLGSLVRVFSPEDWVVDRYLGRGVDGVVVPRLETAAQAEGVLANLRYCYPGSFADKILVIQIETASALENLDGFLALDGIDAYFIGPDDLSKSLGYAGDYRRPEVQEAIDGAITKIRGAGRTAGVLVDYGNVEGYVAAGVRFLYTHANQFLGHGGAAFGKLARGG